MKNISLIVYDFDGTLVDTLEDIALSVNLALEELGFARLGTDTIKRCVGSGVAMLMTRALNGTGYADIDQAVNLFRRHYAEHLMDHTRFYPNGRAILERFADRTQAICSNKPEDFVRQILVHLNSDRFFDAVIGGDTFKTRKPDPEGMHFLLDRYSLKPEQVLMVGDSALDIETGKKAGVHTCAVTYGLGDREALLGLKPDLVIDDLGELEKHIH